MCAASTADSASFDSGKRKGFIQEMEDMSVASIEQEGLLNHAQAALILDVSARRVAELVELGKLTRFDFLGRTYVSVREIRGRREADVKAGRPARSLVGRVAVALKAASKADALLVANEMIPESLKRRVAKKRKK